MLKRYHLTMEEHYNLFREMSHPEVSPYVRNYVADFNEYLKSVNYILEAEKRGEMIVRVIFDEWNQPIGMITLYDIIEHGGFLSTWLGKKYHGKGYNQMVKQLFLNELFNDYDIAIIYLKIRTDNYRSQKATEKFTYIAKVDVNDTDILKVINQTELKYLLYFVTKTAYFIEQEKYTIEYLTINNEEQSLS